jgi:hypothetical protein
MNKKILLRVSKKCKEEKCRKKEWFGLVLFEDKFINLFNHSPFLSSCFSLSLFFCFFLFLWIYRFPSFSFPTFLRFLSLSLFYSFIRRSHHLKFYEVRDCAQWITCYVGRWRKKSFLCHKLISTGKWRRRTGNIRENISEVGSSNWDSKTVFLVCRIYVIFLLHLHASRKNYA